MTSITPVKKHRVRPGVRVRFLHDESGAVTIPSLFWIVFLFFILLSTVEMSVMFMKKTLLEQRVALTSRVMQLGLDGKPDEDTLKTSICSNLTFLNDCKNNITVETFSVDQSNWRSTLDGKAVNCQISKDSADPLPPKNVEYGADDQIMIMRVCLRVKPIIPASPFAKALTAAWPWGDQYALVTTTAYVNEPRIGG